MKNFEFIIHSKTCSSCKGTGVDFGDGGQCDACNGEGVID